MKRVFLVSGCLLFVLAVSWIGRTQATVPEVSDYVAESKENVAIKEMALQSDVIVSGRSLGSESRWIEDGRILVTVATVAVDEAIKGEVGSTVTVVLPGGVDSNRSIPVAMTYAGAPNISAEEEVFLFLTKEDSVTGGYAVTGFSEGKYSIVEDEEGNKLVSRDYIKGKVKNSPGVVRGSRQFVPVGSFKNKIKEYLGQ
jgi:hypothetical protein